MKKKKNIILIVLIGIFIFAFAAASAYLVFRLVAGNNGEAQYERLASDYASRISEINGNTPSESEGEISSDNSVTYADNPINFDSLNRKNKDIYSWIYIPDTNVNYPICQNTLDDNYYLDHDIDGNYSVSGAIYTQFANRRDYTDRVTVIYGHNMRNGSMFADLHKFADSSFFDEHKYMYIYTKNRKLTYEVYSAFSYDDRHIMNSFDFEYDDVYKKFLDDSLKPKSTSSIVRDGTELSIDDKIVVLSTCLNSGEGRYLVLGVLISDEPTK